MEFMESVLSIGLAPTGEDGRYGTLDPARTASFVMLSRLWKFEGSWRKLLIESHGLVPNL